MSGNDRRGAAATPVERVRSSHPEDAAWRADALAGSRHSRLAEELRKPLDDHDPERAATVVAEITRRALRDFAPALVLLPAAERRRAQALAAHALVLFDFAAQSGLEGERLTQINRWEYDLELALDGRPPGQPVFVRMAAAERLRPWRRPALDRLAAAARHRAVVRRPATPEAADAEAETLGAGLAEALLGEVPTPAAVRLAAGLLRTRALVDLDEGLRRHRARLGASRLPDDWRELPDGRKLLESAVEREAEAARRLLDRAGPAALPARLRPAGRFLRAASLELLGRLPDPAAPPRSGRPSPDRTPVLGAWKRLTLLLRARWGL